MSDGPAKPAAAPDPTCRALGIELLELRPGFARLRMRIGDDMANAHGTGHGGIVFLLADAASGYAANADDNADSVIVAHGATITYLAPAPLGGWLTATATEGHRAGRTAIYDVTVTNEAGDTVAVLRATGLATRRR